jgi:cytochrome c oxidase assembly factor CtaG
MRYITGSKGRMSSRISIVSRLLLCQVREALAHEDEADFTETNTIIAACIMFIAILIAWNLPVLRDIISGLKVSGFRFVGDSR